MKNFMMLLSLLLLGATLFGDESINEQIEAIKNAPQTERVKLMNQLKTQIAAMNEKDRANALNTLQQSRGDSANKAQLKLHQGNSQETGGLMQHSKHHNGSFGGQKLQGKQ